MSLKDGLTTHVKKDALYKDLTNKAFRRSLDNFITYRNIFTHGNLCFNYINDGTLIRDEYYLRYIDGPTKTTVITVINKDIIRNYIQTYIEILKFLSNFTGIAKK